MRVISNLLFCLRLSTRIISISLFLGRWKIPQLSIHSAVFVVFRKRLMLDITEMGEISEIRKRNAWPNGLSGLSYSTERRGHEDLLEAEQSHHQAWKEAAYRLRGVGSAAAEGHLVQGRKVHQSQAQHLPIQASQVSIK